MNVFGIASMQKNSAAAVKRAQLSGRIAVLAAMSFATLGASLVSSLPASAAEHSLAGIRIFASVRDVLNKFGDPNQILTGAAAQGGGATNAPAGGGFGGAMMGGPGQIGAVPPMQFGPNGPMGMGMGGGAPGEPGFMAAGGNPGAAGAANGGNPTPGEVLYVYNRPGNITIDFLVSPDGRVIQITVLGYKGQVTTERGVTLGTNYGKIVARYGYPEGQDNNGVSLTMTYLNHDHVSFTLKNEKVVGITVAAIE